MLQRTITVEKEKCIHCGLCIWDCVAACLEFDEEKDSRYLPEGEQRCWPVSIVCSSVQKVPCLFGGPAGKMRRRILVGIVKNC